MNVVASFLVFHARCYLVYVSCLLLAIGSAQAAIYVDNGDGTLTDSAAGLTWMRCAMGQSGSTCSGTANTYTWDQAKALTTSFAGKSDWRLPTFGELRSIVDTSYGSPAIDSSAFPATPATYFWTGSSPVSEYAYYVDFGSGNFYYHSVSTPHHVRLVRSASVVPGAPIIDTVAAGDGSAIVSFTAPASNGGEVISTYTVTASPGGITATGSASPITVLGLSNGTSYTFTVTATNRIGTGPVWLPAYATPTSLTLNSDGTASDSASGLTWMRCAMGQTWTNPSCAGAATAYTWDQATALTASFAGMGDWRLPNIRELTAIRGMTSLYRPDHAVGESYDAREDLIWTTTVDAEYSPGAWGIFDPLGLVDGQDYKYKPHFVHLVRGGQSSTLSDARPDADFADNNDGTVAHLLTGLIWKRCSEGQTWTGTTCSGVAAGFTWGQAAALAVDFSGKNDWRLPTHEELTSLVDYTRYAPSINATVFPNTPSIENSPARFVWAAEAYPDMTYAPCVDFYSGTNSPKPKSDMQTVRLVRRGTPSVLRFVAGWNLSGNGSDTPINVATTFNDASKVTAVWKWLPTSKQWAFYAPGLSGQALADFVVSKGYGALDSIHAGEGFWVNAKTAFTATVVSGSAITAAQFAPALVKGWNLIAVGDARRTPTQVNIALGSSISALWAWDNQQSKWYFYAPSLEASGGLGTYIAGKGYLDFTEQGKTLGWGTGFWVNKP